MHCDVILVAHAELQTRRKKRKLLNGEGESTNLTQLPDTQQKGEEDEERGGTKFNNVESSESEFENGIKMEVQHGGDSESAESAVPELLEDGGMVDTAEKGEGVWPETTVKGLREQLECELTAAKEKFSQRQSDTRGGENLKLKPSFGHRAGFDAFMTGYSFASIAVSLYHKARGNGPCHRADGEGERGLQEKLAGELGEMRNKLANRKNKFPLHILKSHFTCTSQEHKNAQLNIRDKFNKHMTSHHEN